MPKNSPPPKPPAPPPFLPGSAPETLLYLLILTEQCLIGLEELQKGCQAWQLTDNMDNAMA